MESKLINHSIDPVWNESSKALILGSFPSVKSRESHFFYGHPQNRFWKVLAALFGTDTPVTIEDKKRFLLSHGVAVWDVIAKCEITGSSDSSIKNVTANDITPILKSSNIGMIFTNGATADRLYNKYIYPETGIKAVRLPSTSPANAAKNLETLVREWRIIFKAVGEN